MEETLCGYKYPFRMCGVWNCKDCVFATHKALFWKSHNSEHEFMSDYLRVNTKLHNICLGCKYFRIDPSNSDIQYYCETCENCYFCSKSKSKIVQYA